MARTRSKWPKGPALDKAEVSNFTGFLFSEGYNAEPCSGYEVLRFRKLDPAGTCKPIFAYALANDINWRWEPELFQLYLTFRGVKK